MFALRSCAAARATLAAMAVVFSIPGGGALAAPPRDAALHHLTQSLDRTVSWCVSQFDALQHQYIAYRDGAGSATIQVDIAGAQDACLAADQQIPPVLRRYATVAQVVRDWTGVLQQFDAAVADIYGVVFMDADRAASDRDVVRRLHLANSLAVEANSLTDRLTRSWNLLDGG